MSPSLRPALDPIAVVEACYAPTPGEPAWFGGLLEALSGAAELGLYAFSYDAADPARLRIDPRADLRAAFDWRSQVDALCRAASPRQARLLVAARPPVELLTRRTARLRLDAGSPDPDALWIVAADVRNVGTVLGLAQRSSRRPSPRLVYQLTRIAAHVVSGMRLRRHAGTADPEDPGTDAVLEPSGRVADARGDAATEASRRRLADAVRRLDRARGRARRAAPEEALELWQALVDGRWSLVEHVAADGRRLILARKNSPGVRDPKSLAPREREVAAYAALGQSNKDIGYQLGISPASVGTHLASALRKLGLRSRRELIEAMGAPGSEMDERVPP